MYDMELVLDEFSIWVRKGTLGDAIFPRHMSLTRDVVDNEYDYYKFYKRNRGMNIYLAVFSEYQIRRRLYDTIFMDFDPIHKEAPIRQQIKEAYDQYRKVAGMLDNHGYVYRAYFSGRGFHIYIDFEVTRIEHYGYAVRKFLQHVGIVDQHGLSRWVDTRVVGDVRRMARMPGSQNTRTNLFMKRIDPAWDYDKIVEYATSANYDDHIHVPKTADNKDIVRMLIEYDRNATEYRQNVINEDYLEDWDMSAFPKCIYEGIMRIKYLGELDDVWRWTIANFLLRTKGFEETKNVFKYGSDYDESITNYRLQHIIDHEYLIMRCDKLRDIGICPYRDDPSKCPFYPTMNAWLPPWSVVKGDKDETTE